ncbi:MAG TPA: cbb3-type cytochrome c oxidase subunit 3 [Geopsychrobacteraceae bacterium]|nr:cbb3-type cytochrome c oxidase subunit 3 [Geopsychrobacteraceae bacterium]
MDWASILYLGTTFGMFIVFAMIVVRTYRRKNKNRNEAAKYRMLDDD